jgi:ABC-type transporter Mla maintaining outer membrane lipid asymmetry permease subunit MlaE
VNNAVNVATILLGLCAVLGMLGGVAVWLYRRGGHERAYTDALDRNTKANDNVAAKLEEFKAAVLVMFHELDKRVTRLEDRP